MSEKIQCEGCLGYTDEELILLCPGCVDKAASYDITKLELEEHHRAAGKAIELIKSINDIPLDDWPRKLGEAVGTLMVVYERVEGSRNLKLRKTG